MTVEELYRRPFARPLPITDNKQSGSARWWLLFQQVEQVCRYSVRIPAPIGPA